MDLPSGTVTFLLTDIEGSTRLWEEHSGSAGAMLERHDRLIEGAVAEAGGTIVRPRGEGDSRFAVFTRASDAMVAGAAIQSALAAEPWPVPLRVRMAIHTGEAQLREGDYYGQAVNRCARLRSIAHGGQTLVSLSTEELVRDSLPEGLWLKDLGSHQLKDLSRVEHVFQLCAPGLGEDFPLLRSLDAYHHNLPAQLTNFVGRDAEARELIDLMSGSRLVTLTGAAGCGKTRLATQLAAETLDRFPDGVWLVELAPVAAPEMVAGTVAGALGIRAVSEGKGPGTDAAVIDHLRQRTALIVLDNCEHLLEACASLAGAILQACPDVRILATGRESLGIAGEVAWRVPSLSQPGSDWRGGMEGLSGYEAARLFVYRVRTAAPSLTLTDEHAPAIAQICARLDGMPLAIELAASRVDVLSCEQIAERLDDRFRLLTGGNRAALERQQTLRAAVDWSYSLLSPDERTLFQRLAVFAGGFSLEACEVVCSDALLPREDILDLLAALTRKSLVSVDAGGRQARYRLLETMRQYGREKMIDEPWVEVLRERHFGWCLDFAEARAGEAIGREEPLLELEREHDNMRSALDWAISRARAEEACSLAAALGEFWNVRGFWEEGDRWLEQALSLSGAGDRSRARALVAHGRLCWVRGDDARAVERNEEGLELAEAAGDPATMCWAIYARGVSAISAGEVDAAHEAFTRALEIAEATGERRRAAGILNALALLGWGEESEALMERSLSMIREVGDLAGTALLLTNLGVGLLGRDLSAAEARFFEALDYARRAGDRRAQDYTLASLSTSALFRGDLAAAVRFDEEAVAAAEGLTEIWRGARARLAAEELHLAGDLRGAAEAYEAAARSERNPWAIWNWVLRAAELYLTLDEPAAVTRLLDRGAGVSYLGQSRIASRISRMRALVALSEGRPEETLSMMAVTTAQLWEEKAIVLARLHVAVVAHAAESMGRLTEAALMAGAVDGIADRTGAGFTPENVEIHAALLARLRDSLGAEAFQESYDRGRGLSDQEAVEATLEICAPAT